MNGKLYLIPVPLADEAWHTVPVQVYSITQSLQNYCCENARTARRMLRALHPDLVLENLAMAEIDKHSGPDISLLEQWLKEGKSVGMMSEAGCPGIADPGATIAKLAHQCGAQVIPLSGPSAILLALMASGMDGQRFAFHGYLPVKDPQRSAAIRHLEMESKKLDQTQLFIETPYRNNALLQDLLKHCAGSTRLCIAMDITGKNEWIKTMAVSDWRKNTPVLEKMPAVFVLGM